MLSGGWGFNGYERWKSRRFNGYEEWEKREIHIFAESVWALTSAWASSAGSFVAGLPGVVYAWFRLG